MLMHGRDYPQQRITTLSSIYLLHLLGAELLLWSEDGVTAGVVAAPPAPAVRVQRGRAQAAQVVAAHLTRQQLLQHQAKCLNSVLNVKAVVAAFNQKKALRMDLRLNLY